MASACAATRTTIAATAQNFDTPPPLITALLPYWVESARAWDRSPLRLLRCGAGCFPAVVSVDARFDLVAEVPDKPLHRPSGGIAKRADRVSLDLLRNVVQHVDLGQLGAPLRHAFQKAPHPARTFPARRALPAA